MSLVTIGMPMWISVGVSMAIRWGIAVALVCVTMVTVSLVTVCVAVVASGRVQRLTQGQSGSQHHLLTTMTLLTYKTVLNAAIEQISKS